MNPKPILREHTPDETVDLIYHRRVVSSKEDDNMGFSVYRKTGYNNGVIISFKDEETRKIFIREWSKKIPRDIQTIAYRKLAMLHAANALINLQSPPGNKLEKLHGDRTGQYSVRINDRWRICFEWRASDAHNVEIVDYHA